MKSEKEAKPEKKPRKDILHGVEIEKNIPVPEDQKAIDAAKWNEVASNMEVGDSVLVPSTKSFQGLVAEILALKYGVASEPQGSTGTRVWRTS